MREDAWSRSGRPSSCDTFDWRSFAKASRGLMSHRCGEAPISRSASRVRLGAVLDCHLQRHRAVEGTFTSLNSRLRSALDDRGWPGTVRELHTEKHREGARGTASSVTLHPGGEEASSAVTLDAFDGRLRRGAVTPRRAVHGSPDSGSARADSGRSQGIQTPERRFSSRPEGPKVQMTRGYRRPPSPTLNRSRDEGQATILKLGPAVEARGWGPAFDPSSPSPLF